MKFEAKGTTYNVDQFGVVHQVDVEPFVYDAAYSSTYDLPEYKRNSEILQALRIAYCIGAHGRRINSLLDVGYGNGAFMKMAKQTVKIVGGKDVTEVPVPEGCFKTDKFEAVDVITFWDCLEHIPDLMFVRDLPCETVVISLPYCHLRDRGIRWFENDYFHLKKNEHLHHFDEDSLTAFMDNMGWRRVAVAKLEDGIRKRDPEWNILTAAFKRKEEIWKDVKGWEGKYKVSSFGRVKSVGRLIGWGKKYMTKDRILKQMNTPDGYKQVSFPTDNRKSITVRVHRLVCEAFVENYDNKPFVNHKNGVRFHNYATNLEWATCSENVKHGFDYNGRRVESKFKKPIKQIDLTGEIVKIWASGLEMEKEGGYDRSAISAAIRNGKSYYGYRWEYA